MYFFILAFYVNLIIIKIILINNINLMFDDCECGNNCEICEECGLPECECECEKDDEKDENEKDEDEDNEW
jgi:hypothetical protein